MAMAAAAANGTAVACADRVGEERGVTFLGASIIVGPDGWPLAGPASPDGEQLLVADLDLDAVERARWRTPAQPPPPRPPARPLRERAAARGAGPRLGRGRRQPASRRHARVTTGDRAPPIPSVAVPVLCARALSPPPHRGEHDIVTIR